MTGVKWLILAIAAAGAIGLAWHTYFRREPRGRGRGILTALRAFAIILIVLLLLDPRFRAQSRTAPLRVIQDVSLSMGLAGAKDSAQDAVRELRAPVIQFGGENDSRVLPALQTAAEAGAHKVVLVTDGAITDMQDVAHWLPTLDLDVDVRDVGGVDVANRAIANVEAPGWAEAGKPLTMRVSVAAAAMSGNANVLVKLDGKELARATVTLPASGTTSATLTFNASGPPQGGFVRYDVAFDTPDAIKDDDVRSIYVFVSERPAGVAILSFDPDWEPRFLHPVLADALGLPVRTFLRVPAGLYFRGGNGADAGAKVDESVVRDAVKQAALVVFHGLGSNAPEWAQQAAASARHSILFPENAQIDGDWYVAPQLPSSPITSLLAGMDVSELPPLTSLQTSNLPDYEFAPIVGGMTPRGGSMPFVVAGTTEGRHWVIALGRGYWRWAFRGGNAKDAYTRLWGALAGWVVQGDAQVAASALRPLNRSVARGSAIQWVSGGIAADSLVVDMNGRRSVLQLQGDTASSAAPAPGHYVYDVRAFAGGKEIASARGPLTVESYSPEFIRRRADMSVFKSPPAALQKSDRRAGRPLHSYSWIYVLLVALLASEWILRRRWGLR